MYLLEPESGAQKRQVNESSCISSPATFQDAVQVGTSKKKTHVFQDIMNQTINFLVDVRDYSAGDVNFDVIDPCTFVVTSS